ncbi:GNAT family N-acetyltransferase [Ferruginibacter sp. SUN002]|uniref:GNAT family N-acetyltransferase n=1 Tax=Ferruginibacter sp. SUN002 TaxID=2937789 RepID=UPI003D36DF89
MAASKKYFSIFNKTKPMDIQHKEEGHKGSFYIEQEGKQVAEMVYSLSDANLLIIEHTEVDDILKGKNIGAQLAHATAEYAREKHYTIIPLCPFANAFFKKRHEAYKDVLRS